MAEAAVIKRLTDDAEDLSNGSLGHLRDSEMPVKSWSEARGGGKRLERMDEGMEAGVVDSKHTFIRFYTVLLTLTWPSDAYVGRNRRFCCATITFSLLLAVKMCRFLCLLKS